MQCTLDLQRKTETEIEMIDCSEKQILKEREAKSELFYSMNRLILILLFLSSLTTWGAVDEITPETIGSALEDLDNRLKVRDRFIESRQRHIDSLKTLLADRPALPDSLRLIMDIADGYTSFKNDSALHYLNIGISAADYDLRVAFRLKRATLLPLVGIIEDAMKEYEDLDPETLPHDLKIVYFDGARQMYSYVASFYEDYPEYTRSCSEKSIEAQRDLIGLLPKNSQRHKLNLGEYYHLTGDDAKARILLSELISTEPVESNLRARASHIMSTIARDNDKDRNTWIYYLIQSAISDVSSATLEVTSLQDLGAQMFSMGDIDRAYLYLSTALDNAVSCHASMRMLQSARSLPIIEKAYSAEIGSWRTRIYWIIGALILLLLALVGLLLFLRNEMRKMASIQQSLKEANHVKEVYISRFLSLCSIYMDKLNQFCDIANRKISTGNVDDLYRMTKSGKFVEEQSKEFYEVFDDAFLHIYPTFVGDVNRLLKDGQKISLKEGERLNTDLRILAFMRLGIEDTSRIAQILNYSVNTIYAYRNKLKGRAIDRESFERDIMGIGS